MKKNALFVFNGNPMCFIHVLLNALDMHIRGDTVKIIVEGAANTVGRFNPRSKARMRETITVAVATENMHFFDFADHKAIR